MVTQMSLVHLFKVRVLIELLNYLTINIFMKEEKTLNNTSINDAKQKVSDIEVFGNGDLFQLISKASSKSQGWMKSTKAMETPTGCVIQVTTQNRDRIAEALTFVPGSKIMTDDNGDKYIG